MSSAFLYLAIVAIWLGVLVPRWLRPAQVVARPAETRQRDDNPWTDSDSDTEPIPRITAEDERQGLRVGASAVERRGVVLRARRRMLMMVTGLALGAVTIAVAHLAAWWVVVPPGFMLGGFLMLLREAVKTDAERARRIDAYARVSLPVRQEAAEGVAEGVMAAETVREPVAAPVVVPAEPERSWSAKIIDISARIGDQLYDQYTDAAERAVGD